MLSTLSGGDSSGDDDWVESGNTVCKKLGDQCWECGERFHCTRNLIEHYKSHNTEATCYICKVTFRRMTSLWTHLNNAHLNSVLFCINCKQHFNSLWQLNKHIGTHLTPTTYNYFNKAAEPTWTPFSKQGLLSKLSEAVAQDHTYCNSPTNGNDIDHAYSFTKQSDDNLTQWSGEPIDGDNLQWTQEIGDIDAVSDGSVSADEVEDMNVMCRNKTKGETTVTNSSSNGNDSDQQRSGEEDEISSCVNYKEEVEDVGEQSDENTQSLSDTSDSDFNITNLSESDSDTSRYSSSSSHSPDCNSRIKSSNSTSTCFQCGRGPFRNVKVHLLHCFKNRTKIALQCPLCKERLPNQKAFMDHKVSLYACKLCSQVFHQNETFQVHCCPSGKMLFGPPTMLHSCDTLASDSLLAFTKATTSRTETENQPIQCFACKAFFKGEHAVLNHVIQTHNTKLFYAVRNELSSTGLAISSAKIRQSTSSPSQSIVCNVPFFPFSSASQQAAAPVMIRVVVNEPSVKSGTKLMALQPPACTLTGVVPQNNVATTQSLAKIPTKALPSKKTNLVPQLLNPQSRIKNRLFPAPTLLTPAKAPPPVFMSVPAPAAATLLRTTSTGPVTVVTMFENNSREMALKQRMSMNWREKSIYPCRQCGAMSRQSSLAIRHRYVHRGPRPHSCHCGRTFQHRLHLLRHCMLHAEATTYVCVNCGDTFYGAQSLVEHMGGTFRRSKRIGTNVTLRPRKVCRVPLTCPCGQVFAKHSAYLWHQLQNSRTKHRRSHKKPSE